MEQSYQNKNILRKKARKNFSSFVKKTVLAFLEVNFSFLAFADKQMVV